MIKVIARSVIKPGGLKEALALYSVLVEKTRGEPHCLAYELYQELENEHNLTLIEEWESMDALHRHTQTPHFVEPVAKLAQYESELPVEIYRKLF